MSQLGSDCMSPASETPFWGPRLELKERSQRSKRNMSPTLAEISQLVGHARRDSELNDDSSVQRVLDVPNDSTSVPLVLSFNNLTYSVRVGRKITLPVCFRKTTKLDSPRNMAERSTDCNRKVLLNDVSGEAREGEIMAVLGASGSGKSTLIDALADRIAKESLKGTITLNGEVLESGLLKAISAYVMQEDLLFPMLTVEETLMFSAEFRLPRSLSASKKKARVQALIDQLGLQSAAKTVIGDEGHRGVSGGERRRVSIGMNIIHDPIILFLDEPTSGLDSTSAFMVVKVLQRIAKSGSIVIMSIHQPSYRILNLLGHLIFLSRGQTVFNGSPASLPEFFSEFGNPIPEEENKMEFALDLIRELEGSSGGTKTLVDFNKSWRIKNLVHKNIKNGPKLSLKDAISASISKGKLVSNAINVDSNSNPTSLVPTFSNPFWIEIVLLAKRTTKNSRRMPELFGMRLGMFLIAGIISATIFRKLDDSAKGVKERIGFFQFVVFTTYITCAETLPIYLMERYIFIRETNFNAYRRVSYVVSHSLTSIPSILFLSLTFAVITYWAVGLAGGISGFLFFFLAIVASFWAGSSFVTLVSGVISDTIMGYIVVAAMLCYFAVFTGFFISRDRIPPYWIWFHYLSLAKYPYEGVLQNEFNDSKKCFVRGVQIFDNSPLEDSPMAMKLKMLKAMGETLGFFPPVPLTLFGVSGNYASALYLAAVKAS
ncbi:ABC transporter G member 6 [Sarracenia purpurea var. burkii]